MVPPHATEVEVVRQAIERGIPQVRLHRRAGQGRVSADARPTLPGDERRDDRRGMSAHVRRAGAGHPPHSSGHDPPALRGLSVPASLRDARDKEERGVAPFPEGLCAPGVGRSFAVMSKVHS